MPQTDGRGLRSSARVSDRVEDTFVVGQRIENADGGLIAVGHGTLELRERRSRRRSPADRVLLTVLFADLVGSTRRAGDEGDEIWRTVLEDHHAVVRRQIEAHGGREVKTTGDGFLVTFDSPSRAVQCARAIKVGLAKLGLELRTGVHTGECELIGVMSRGWLSTSRPGSSQQRSQERSSSRTACGISPQVRAWISPTRHS